MSVSWRPKVYQTVKMEERGCTGSLCKVGVECFTWSLYAKSGYSQLQLQSFTMGRTTRVIVVSVPPLKLLQ